MNPKIKFKKIVKKKKNRTARVTPEQLVSGAYAHRLLLVSRVFRGVPGCSGVRVFGCSGVPMFRCSCVPGCLDVPGCSGVTGFSTYMPK